MIKIINISKKEVEVSQENCYITDDDTAMSIANVFVDIEDEEVDLFRGYQYNEMGMVFINSTGFWTDFELISPQFVSRACCEFEEKVFINSGFPYLKVVDILCFPTVQKFSTGFLLWLENQRKIDRIIKNQNLEFYCEKDILVGIRFYANGSYVFENSV